ncbi:CubicO group peptidase (beta-lactamase class C family) [Paenibacillus cellulosilyticus]|uniref:CubicO group peptidase (Beta-lactamase class C family) n=1 Tax=Paenibacillus cellulosilyticus TaxID=375489 RepID=A0A2V2YE27_9BACL|nr:serine hydrolase domain-containing protein [Paenibacillus cellulosilyticus]PWV90536.1 CubicO group peptidase (beta-lactamase class C family) [Paenibacillus cellulosilyticus]QKS47081.1 beta-lactamase family protein [Paenibacillus cellulosilyticus]
MESVITIHEGRTDAAPEQVGMDAERLALLDRHFGGLIEAGKLQGASYLVARDGKIIVHRSQGKLTNKSDSPDLKPDSIRKVYSITKAFTAAAITRLAEEGLLHPTQSVSTILPEFDTAMHRGISIWHLITHTSGIGADPDVLGEPYAYPWYEWFAHESKKRSESWSKSDTIKGIISGKPLAKPGEQWIYGSSGYALLAEIIERVSGVSYETYIKQHFLEPLGMGRTFMRVPEMLRDETCYVGDWGQREIYEPRPADDDMLPAGGNGFYSTLHDLYRFGQALLEGGTLDGNTVLGRRSVQMMVSDQLKDVKNRCWGNTSDDSRYAFGLGLGGADLCSPATFSHEGFGHSGLYVDPIERLVYVFFVPSKAGWVPESVINPRNIIWSALL